MQINKTFLILILLIVGLAATACQKSQSSGGGGSAVSGSGNTPTEAFKSLFAAVKSKNTDAIKANMSKATIEFAEGVAQMQKKTPEEMFKNGLTEAAMSENLPPVRNERVNGNFGALEVQNAKGTWEDLPFVLEDGRWKLAVGEMFKNTYQKPAPSQSETEANNNVPQIMPGAPGNANMNAPMNSNNAVKPVEEKKMDKSGAKLTDKDTKLTDKEPEAKSEAKPNDKK